MKTTMTDRPPHASELVARAGAAIYGAEWQNPLARQLGIAERTMRRLAAAAREGQPWPVAPGALRDLVQLVAQASGDLLARQHALEHLTGELTDLLEP